MPRPANLEVRSRLLSTGRQVILSRGFHGSGVQDVTAAAGVPKGSFYNYFGSKEAFAVEMLEEYWSSIEDLFGPILYDARVRPLGRIESYFQSLAEYHERSNFRLGCLLGNLALELAGASEEARLKVADLFGRWEASLAACLREARERGDLAADRDVEGLAAVLIEAFEGAVMRAKVEQCRGPFRRFEAVVLPRLLA